MSEISNFAQFDAALAHARAGINRLNLANPGDAFLESISRQLSFVFDWTRGGKRPTDEQSKKVLEQAKKSRAEKPHGIKPWRATQHPDWLTRDP